MLTVTHCSQVTHLATWARVLQTAAAVWEARLTVGYRIKTGRCQRPTVRTVKLSVSPLTLVLVMSVTEKNRSTANSGKINQQWPLETRTDISAGWKSKCRASMIPVSTLFLWPVAETSERDISKRCWFSLFFYFLWLYLVVFVFVISSLCIIVGLGVCHGEVIDLGYFMGL